MQRVHHIGIAVNDMEESLALYRTLLKDIKIHREEVPDQEVSVAAIPLGDTQLELLQPTTGSSPVAAFIAKRGPGIHHLAFEVENIRESLKKLEEAGYRLIDREPRDGAMGMKIAFVHPRSTGGVLIELCQPAKT